MDKARVVFVAVMEEDIPEGTDAGSPEDHAKALNDRLQKSLLMSTVNRKIKLRYASREVLDENGDAKSAETIVHDAPSGLFECFHCGERTVGWMSDFMFEDYGYEGEGIVQNCHCSNCGADIEYRIPLGPAEE